MVRRCSIVVVSAASVVALLAFLVGPPRAPTSLDEAVARWAARLPDGAATLARPVTALGASLTVGLLLAVVAAISFVRERRLVVAVFLAVVVAGEIILTNLIKSGIDRARPAFDRLVDTTGSSYPSGHSAAAAAAYAAIALALARGRPPAVRRGLMAVAVAIALAVAASRVVLGVHWLTDVVGGLAFGWGWVTLCALVVLRGPAGAELASATGSPAEPDEAGGTGRASGSVAGRLS